MSILVNDVPRWHESSPLEAGGVLVGEKVVLELEISAIKAA